MEQESLPGMHEDPERPWCDFDYCGRNLLLVVRPGCQTRTSEPGLMLHCQPPMLCSGKKPRSQSYAAEYAAEYVPNFEVVRRPQLWIKTLPLTACTLWIHVGYCNNKENKIVSSSRPSSLCQRWRQTREKHIIACD